MTDDREGLDHDKAAGARALCGARKRSGEGTCRRPAGWGTAHSGEGKCKLHGGCTPIGARGADHPNFRHGRYAQFLSPGEEEQLTHFCARFEWTVPPEELKPAVYRLLTLMLSEEPVGLLELAGALRQFAQTQVAWKAALEGVAFEVVLSDAQLQEVLLGFVEVLVKHVPEERLPAALADLEARRDLAGLRSGRRALAPGPADADGDD